MSETVAAQQVVKLVEWARKRFNRPAEDWQARPGETRAVDVVIRQIEQALAAQEEAAPEGPKENGIIKRRTPDDEVVGYGHVHIERMDKDHIWMNICGEPYDFYAKGKKLIWRAQLGWSLRITG